MESPNVYLRHFLGDFPDDRRAGLSARENLTVTS